MLLLRLKEGPRVDTTDALGAKRRSRKSFNGGRGGEGRVGDGEGEVVEGEACGCSDRLRLPCSQCRPPAFLGSQESIFPIMRKSSEINADFARRCLLLGLRANSFP